MTFTKKTLQTHTTGMSFIKGASLFFLGMSCVLFATQAFDIVPSTTNVKQYIQEILLTTNGLSAGTQKISLDGATGNGSFSGTVSASIINGTTINGTTVTATTLSGTTINGTTITGTNICLGGVCKTARPTAGGASVWSTGVATALGMTGIYAKFDVGYSSIKVGAITGVFGQTLISMGFLKITGTGGLTGLSINQTNQGIGTIDNSDGRLIISASGNTNQLYLEDDGKVGIGTSPTEKLHVSGTGKFTNGLIVDGKVGIGITSPNEKLHVVGTGKFTQGVIVDGYIGTTSGINFGGGYTSNPKIYRNGLDLYIGGATQFGYPSSTYGNVIIADYINTKVAIGTGTASAKLTVEGGIKPISVTENPCVDTGAYPEGTMFYNSINHYYCYCTNTTTGIKIDEGTLCF